MRCSVRPALAGAVALVVLLSGCTGDGSGSAQPSSGAVSSATVTVASAEELAAALITPEDDLEGDWTLTYEGGDSQDGTPGVITEAEQEEGVAVAMLCARAGAESRAAAEALRFKAGRQMVTPGQDPAASGVLGPYISEYLTSGDPADIEATFNALRDGMQDCLGEESGSTDVGEYSSTIEELALPKVGEDRYGNVGAGTTLEDEEVYHDRVWQALVRSGPVLMYLQVAGGTRGDVEPLYTEDELAELTAAVVTTATGKLP